MIHSRNALADLVNIISEHEADHLTGVFHCFTGTTEEAEQLLSFPGFALGIGGVLTFKKSKLPDVLKSTVPLLRIVLETDAPYMSPVPIHGSKWFDSSKFLSYLNGSDVSCMPYLIAF